MTAGTTPTPAAHSFKSGYAPVNGLEMYYEIHGAPGIDTTTPLVLVHGALSAIGTSFGPMLPLLAASRQVIAVEMQAHGRTADIDRPLTVENLAGDVAALLNELGIDQADLLGYSLGSSVALELAIQHPEMVRKLVLISVAYSADGLHPGLLDGIQALEPQHLVGSPFYDEYMSLAPNPGDFPVLIDKVKRLDSDIKSYPEESIRSLKAPALLIIGDSDIVRPEHAVAMFRLLGGGVAGDVAGLPNSQLAVIPGSSHVTVVHRAAWIASMAEAFLALPVPGIN